MSRRTILKVIASLFLGALTMTAAYGLYHSLQKPFTLDEVIMVRTSHKITEMGPRAYLPEEENGGGEMLPHPPLYDYMNALVLRVFGFSEALLRGVGFIFYLCALAVLLLLIKHVFPVSGLKSGIAFFLASSIYIINPLILQKSIMIDGDSAVTAFLIILFMYLFIRFEKLDEDKFVLSRCVLAFVLAVSFMIKEITPFLISGSVMVFRLFKKDLKRTVLDLFITIVAGFSLFWIAWCVYSYVTSTPVFGFLDYTIIGKRSGVAPGSILRQLNPAVFLQRLKWIFYWPTAPFSFLVIASFLAFARETYRSRRIPVESIVFISSFLIFFVYHFAKPSVEMVKYQYTVYPLFIFGVTWFFMNFVFDKGCFSKEEGVLKVFAWGALVTIALSFYYYRIGDYLLLKWFRFPATFYLEYFGPVIAVSGFFYLLFRKEDHARAVLLGLLFCVYPISIGLTINQVAPYTTSSPWMNYGEEGFKDTVEYLVRHVDPEKVSVMRRDLSYYLNFVHGVDVDTIMPRRVYRQTDPGRLADMFMDGRIQYFVLETRWVGMRTSEQVLDIIGRFFVVEREFGDFLILRNRHSIMTQRVPERFRHHF